MANSQKPDRDVEYMKEMWGTDSLITDYVSEKLMTPTIKKKNDPPQNRLEKFCGGKDGFDDYAEWLV